MALPTNNSRPNVRYVPKQRLNNADRYKKGKVAEDYELNADFNFLTDWVNILCNAINELVLGIMPGADDPLNTNKLPTTDGQRNISWTLVQSQHIEERAILEKNIGMGEITGGVTGNIAPATITGDNIAPATITGGVTGNIAPATIRGSNIAARTITGGHIAARIITGGVTGNIAPATITGGNIAPATITGGNIAPATITGGNIADNTILPLKINSSGVATGSVLTVSNNIANFILPSKKGKILQIQSLCERNTADTYHSSTANNFVSFNKPFEITITPLSRTSIIMINISMNIAAIRTESPLFPAYFCAGLFKNGVLWDNATGDDPNFNEGIVGLFGGITSMGADLKTYNININDPTEFVEGSILRSNLNMITYEVKVRSSPYVPSVITLNCSYNTGGAGYYYDGTVGVSTLNAIELELAN